MRVLLGHLIGFDLSYSPSSLTPNPISILRNLHLFFYFCLINHLQFVFRIMPCAKSKTYLKNNILAGNKTVSISTLLSTICLRNKLSSNIDECEMRCPALNIFHDTPLLFRRCYIICDKYDICSRNSSFENCIIHFFTKLTRVWNCLMSDFITTISIRCITTVFRVTGKNLL